MLGIIMICDFQQIHGGQQISLLFSSAGLPVSAGDKRRLDMSPRF